MFKVAILTAKEVEFDAVRQYLEEIRREDKTFDGTVYRVAKIKDSIVGEKNKNKWEVAIYRTGRGQQPTTYGTQVLMQHFRPNIVMYVGVAGGAPTHKDLSIGDVVVGKVVRHYERTSQREADFTIKPLYFEPNRALVSAAEFEADDSAWLKLLQSPPKNTNVFVEEIASGEKVQKSSASPLWTAIKTAFPDIIAVETEGHGFHYAVAQAAGRALMVRAVSDMLDNKDDDKTTFGNDDDRQKIASDNAAAFAINLIINLNTHFIKAEDGGQALEYAVILKIAAVNLAGVQKVTQIMSEVINDTNLKLESINPSNSFIIRITTSLQSAAFAKAAFSGKLISDLVGIKVFSLEADVERTGEPVFDNFLNEVKSGKLTQSTRAKIISKYPDWSSAVDGVSEKITDKINAKENALTSLYLISVGDKKIEVIKEIRAMTGLGLKESKDMIESTTPTLVLEGRPRKDLRKNLAQLKKAGATARISNKKL